MSGCGSDSLDSCRNQNHHRARPSQSAPAEAREEDRLAAAGADEAALAAAEVRLVVEVVLAIEGHEAEDVARPAVGGSLAVEALGEAGILILRGQVEGAGSDAININSGRYSDALAIRCTLIHPCASSSTP